MIITIPRVDLVRELEVVEKIVGRKQTIPILGNVLVQADGAGIALSATDLEVSVRSRCAISEIPVPGAFTLPGKRLLDLARTLPDGDVRLDASDVAKVVLAAAGYKVALQTLPAANFPTIPRPADGVAAAAIPRAVLRDLIGRTRFAVTTKDTRYFLNGTLLEIGEGLARMVGTDGHRLAKAETAVAVTAPKVSFVIPKVTLDALWPLLDGDGADVAFSAGESHLFFDFGDRVLVSRLMSGTFPNYSRVIPAELPVKLTVGRVALAEALRRALLVGTDRKATLTLTADALLVAAQNVEVGSADERITAQYAGPEIRVAVNAEYVSDFADVAGAEQVTVEAKDDISQMVWRPLDASGYVYVVMPMRV